MRKLITALAMTTLAAGAFACGHETHTVVRRQTVTTETVPAAPVVVERHTVIEPAPVVPQERVYEERKTTIEHE